MSPDSHTVQILGETPGPEVQGATLDIFQAGNQLQVRVSSPRGSTDIILDPTELLLGVRVMVEADAPQMDERKGPTT